MYRRTLRHVAIALLLLVALLGQVTWALASTTGRMQGSVVDTDTGAPLAGVTIKASSPSETVSTQTDAVGRFVFVSLVPDTYTVSAEKEGYSPINAPGVVVFADQAATVPLRLTKSLKTIANVTSRTAGNLVRPGTTSDVYSVNAAMQDKVSALGGGGSLNSAYSAVASVPGAFVPLNQTGYFQTVHIRGGDYDQVGYELDGVPVNRSFDNYPSGAASSLGQQEVQVYTGATPANSEGEGLAGYINQVIKTGTFPGFGTGAFGIGTPTFYHKAAVEAGGSTPNRMFSYYVGVGGYNQNFRYVDQFNAQPYTFLSSPITPAIDPGGCTSIFTGFASCYAAGGFGVGPGGWNLAPYPWANIANIADRDVIMNFHFAVPHHKDGGRDDIQVLWDSGLLNNQFYESTNDSGGPASYNGIANVPTWIDGFQWSGPVGTLVPSNYQSFVSNYLFPNSPTNRALNSTLPFDQRDTTWNNQEVVKVQYQKNFGTNAYVRLYGYTYYSNWLQNGPNCAFQNYVCAVSPDYELSSHTRGLSLQASDQINPENLLSFTASYTTASTIRDNNTQMFNGGGSRSRAFVAVNSANPLSGLCYTVPTSGTGAATPTTCDPTANVATFGTWAQAAAGQLPNVTGATCGNAPCGLLVAENSLYATYNTVQPSFLNGSLTDELRLGDRLLFNLGVRLDTFQFNGSNTNTGPARDFWFNSWNLDNCQNTSSGVVQQKVLPTPTGLGLNSPTDPCPAGFTAVNMQNVSSPVNYYQVWEPRISGTYTVDPNTVVRFSYGKYVEPPNTAFEQYNALQENLPWLLGTTYNFYAFGFTTPGHAVSPPVSYNTDLSLEHRFKGTELSFKLTPFLRKTANQIQNFFLNQQTGFVSGFNVGRQTSEGFEFQVNEGDFARNGFAGQLSFAYTNSYIQYNDLPNGTTVVSPINAAIEQYNGFTSACHSNAIAHGGTATNPRCGANSAASAPCYTASTTATPGGAPDPTCGPGSIASPYWNAPVAATLDPFASYPTYDIFPGAIGTSGAAFGSPYVVSAILNYKHNRFAITPTMQFVAGARYGAPLSEPGIDPTAGCASLTGPVTAGDPRYPYGSPGGSPYNAVTCAGQINIPNPYTHQFDPMGSFVQPNQYILNLQFSYDVTPRITLVGTFANIVAGCWGGTSTPWNLTNNGNVCQYNVLNTAGTLPPVGNFYNWTPAQQTPIQRMVQFPYAPYLGGVNVDSNGNGSVSNKGPFQFYIEARLKV